MRSGAPPTTSTTTPTSRPKTNFSRGAAMTLPNRLFRVDALVGYGWPECREQIQEHRTFATAQQAADWVAVLESMPSHHKLISVNRTDTAWLPVLPEELPPARVKRTQRS